LLLAEPPARATISACVRHRPCAEIVAKVDLS
jgi:hypothetical protein